jgi:WD40 repeat protein
MVADSVLSIAIHNKTIISGSLLSIKIWDISNCNCIKTLNGYHDDVYSIAIHNNTIIYGDPDSLIKVWV